MTGLRLKGRQLALAVLDLQAILSPRIAQLSRSTMAAGCAPWRRSGTDLGQGGTLSGRHLLEANHLAEDIFKQVNAPLARKGLLLKRGSIVDATIIAAPSSTKNSTGERDPEMHQPRRATSGTSE